MLSLPTALSSVAYQNNGIKVRQHLTIRGVVQGVGFRPFIYGLATDLGLSGFVGNHSNGVFIEIEGSPDVLDAFHARLETNAPPLAVIEEVSVATIAPTGQQDFTIVASEAEPTTHTLISPDLCVCDDCLQELFDPTNRRYGYPFINCTNCGPRFTITKDIPYDRPLTTMAGFSMCGACQAEYDDPTNRRFHAQPNACEACGPQVWIESAARGEQPVVNGRQQIRRGHEVILAAQNAICKGRVVAIKGLGGFHLACDATNDAAVQTLRDGKGRVDKPFAIMVPDLAIARQFAYISDAEEQQLTSRIRPILLLKKREYSPLSALVAPGNNTIGIMLPYTPLHYLLFQQLCPLVPLPPCDILVMTSGNLSSEPIVIDNNDAKEKLAPLADAFLLHNRPIHVPCDDSVIRVVNQQEYPIRRSRGYAPFPVKLPMTVKPTLAVGGELKSTFCLADGRYAFMSQHIGDMENLETLHAFEESINHSRSLFRHKPQILVSDMHPRYLSTHYLSTYYLSKQRAESQGDKALDEKKPKFIKVQHHHAHVAALMAESGLDGSESVIGFSFDGTGYGSDGAIWGGEVLIADYVGFRRAAHLAYVPLVGGDAAVKHPARMALAHLWSAGVPWTKLLPPVACTTRIEQGVIQRQLDRNINSVQTSSMGRLFDAVAALAGVRQHVTYEGQAAIEFEALCDLNEQGTYTFTWRKEPSTQPVAIEAAPVIEAVAADVLMGVPISMIAARFHRAVVNLILSVAFHLRRQEQLHHVALTGGVFQNTIVLEASTAALNKAGFDVLHHRKVPPNDGGLALGQVVIANAQLATMSPV
ncbi:MAG: carbamoyltransferase HypF [Chloroflexota bacterium]